MLLLDGVIDCTLMPHTMSSVFAHCLFCLSQEIDFDKEKEKKNNNNKGGEEKTTALIC